MSKAEEKLLEKARKFSLACATSLERNGKSLCWSDLDIAYIKGYRQAEKDFELTYDDICEIMEIREDVLEMDSYENLYEEILKRFKERKE